VGWNTDHLSELRLKQGDTRNASDTVLKGYAEKQFSMLMHVWRAWRRALTTVALQMLHSTSPQYHIM
jgi:hypothetical protein